MFDNQTEWCVAWWRSSRVPDLRSIGRRFESKPPRCRVQPWASCYHTCASVTKQYNLVPANGRWCLAAGKVTIGLASHWPRIKYISGSPHTGSRPGRGRWTLPMLSCGARLTLPLPLNWMGQTDVVQQTSDVYECCCAMSGVGVSGTDAADISRHRHVCGCRRRSLADDATRAQFCRSWVKAQSVDCWTTEASLLHHQQLTGQHCPDVELS